MTTKKTCNNCIYADTIKLHINGEVSRMDCWKTGEMVSEDYICDGWGPAPREGMRPIMVTATKGVESGIGFFHGFSQDFIEFESGPAPYPVAIVEMWDGKVQIVNANLITFLNEDPREGGKANG